jgi:hypothetical protein
MDSFYATKLDLTPVLLLCELIILLLSICTSHHKLVYQHLEGNIYVYLAAGHRQDYPTTLLKRFLRR